MLILGTWVYIPIPEAFIAEKGLPSIDNLFELGQLPLSGNERVVAGHSRGINVHELELEDHVQLFVRR